MRHCVPIRTTHAGLILDNLKLAEVRVEVAVARETLRAIVRRPNPFRLQPIVYILPVSESGAPLVG